MILAKAIHLASVFAMIGVSPVIGVRVIGVSPDIIGVRDLIGVSHWGQSRNSSVGRKS